MTPHDRIWVDNQRAHDHASKYLAAVDAQMFARCLSLTTAMQKFGEFLHLPESTSKLMLYFEAALTMLSFVQPEIFFVKFLGEGEKAVELALAIGEASSSITSKAIKIAGKVGEAAEKVKAGVEKYDAHQEKQEKMSRAPEAAAKLKQLDAAKKPVQQMLEAYKRAQGIWSGALDALDKELAKRLDADPKAAAPKESLEAMAKRVLKSPEPFTEAELDQVETLYLWKITNAWVRDEVTIVLQMYEPSGLYVRFDGINDTQLDTLQEWFGPETCRGKVFYEAPSLSGYPRLLLMRLEAKTVTPPPINQLPPYY